ncbi:hypothetical protein ACU61A_27220 [Pseudonocardia sichuanensis]
MSAGRKHEQDDRPETVRQAEKGAQAWRAVVHAQQSATPDHADFYALAAELADTFASLTALGRVLARQVAGYADGLPAGERVYDDTPTADPRDRLALAAVDLRAIVGHIEAAQPLLGSFWARIGHIGVEDAPNGTDGEVSR